MKYEKTVERITSGKMSRKDLALVKKNAEEKLKQGDMDAKLVLDAIKIASPLDRSVLFMGFCPDADFENRLDIEWKEKGICRFDYLVSEVQLARFQTVCAGDLVILKKREKFGVSMTLHGHGRVLSIENDEDNIRYLKMSWSSQNRVIEVPLIGCNSTVDIKSIESVEAEMPEEFYEWLSE